MSQWEVQLDASRFRVERRARRSIFGRGAAAGRAEIFICRLSDGVVSGVHARRAGGGVHLKAIRLDDPDQPARFFQKRRKRPFVVALLPKSQYLIKALEIPKVLPQDAVRILSLEVETILPQEFGPPEISYVGLPGREDGYQRYEVYISRQQLLRRLVTSLTAAGVRPSVIVPSAVVWRRLLGAIEGADLLVARPDSGVGAEAAYLEHDRSLSVRTIGPSFGGNGNNAFQQGLVESLRSLMASPAASAGPLVVGWLGGACPPRPAGGRVVFESLNGSVGKMAAGGAELIGNAPLLCAAAQALVCSADDQSLRTSNLLPREMILRRQRRTVHKSTAVAAVSVLLSAVLVYAALKARIVRCRAISGELSRKIALIKTEGEAVGRRIGQLEAIRQTRATRDDFYEVLAGLYGATPDGVTYGHVQLNEAGKICLRGQAPSLALPLLLPERLENEPMFVNVVPRDTAQTKKAGGTVAEFRVDCTIRRAKD